MNMELKKLFAILFLWAVISMALSVMVMCLCGCATMPQERRYMIDKPVAVTVCNDAAFAQHAREFGQDPWGLGAFIFGRCIFVREGDWKTENVAHEFRHLPEIEGKFHEERL